MKHWIVEHDDGSITQHITNSAKPEKEGIDCGKRHAQTKRQADLEIEKWDWSKKKWTPDQEKIKQKSHIEIDEKFGKKHIELAHQRKLNEAYALRDNPSAETPFLTGEAEARGLTVHDLALLIREKNIMLAALEIERMKQKLA